MNNLYPANNPQPSYLAPNPLNTPSLPNNPQPPTNLNGNPIYPQSVQQMMSLLNLINSSQGDSNLQLLMSNIELEKQLLKYIIWRACSFEQVKEWEKYEQSQHTVQRCTKIKARNARILSRVMNLRTKLVKNMNMYKTRSQEREIEIGFISQKIRGVQSEITSKYNRLKALKVLKKNESPLQTQIRPVSSNMPFAELRKGVEVLQKEALKLREEMSVLQKYMHQGSI